VFVENVAALLRRGFDRVQADLAEIGYDTDWICLRASDIGAAHRRDRLFVLATRTGHAGDVADAVRP
jgi:DNA (cytosine-5)-methyltransferase 1